MCVLSLGQGDLLDKGMVTHSSILAWRIPWAEEPGGLQSIGSHRVWNDWSNLHTHTHTLLGIWLTTFRATQISGILSSPWTIDRILLHLTGRWGEKKSEEIRLRWRWCVSSLFTYLAGIQLILYNFKRVGKQHGCVLERKQSFVSFTLILHFWLSNMQVFFPHTKEFWDRSSNPTVQFSSDTICLELASPAG